VRFDIEPEQEAGPQLRAIGIGPRDVGRIVMTHLHIDHDGGLKAFPESEILVGPGELARASGIAGRIRGYLPQRWPEDFNPKPLVLDDGPYGPFVLSKRLSADGAIVAVSTSGHTADHLSVIVEDGDKAVFIAGDPSYSESDNACRRGRRRQRRRRPSHDDARRHPGVRRGAADDLFACARSRCGAPARQTRNVSTPL
jgi:N-acyl homoserine lactone hydrolase